MSAKEGSFSTCTSEEKKEVCTNGLPEDYPGLDVNEKLAYSSLLGFLGYTDNTIYTSQANTHKNSALLL